jgi:hypothetical protein
MSGNRHDPKQPISLDPENTPQGTMERVFLAETYEPSKTTYDSSTDLEQMRDMRQAIENRLKDPAEYDARGAKNEIDIVKMGDQFQGFSNYPELDGNIQTRIDDNFKIVNDPHDPRQAAYAQHVQDAQTAASESIAHPLAGYPNATAWLTEGSTSPGAGFYALGSLGNNTFYCTLSQRSQNIKSGNKTDGLEGKTPVEKLRHYAAQARADAAQKSASKHKKLRISVKKRHNIMPSFAPHSGHPTGQPTSAAHSDTGFRPDPALARSSLQRKMDDLLQSRTTGVTTEGFAGTGGAVPEIWDVAEFLPAGSHGQIEHGRMTRTIRVAASLGLRVKSRSGSALPSMAPRRSSHGSGDAAPLQRAMLAGDTPMPGGPASVQATGSLMLHPRNTASATSLAPRVQGHAATASYALETDFAQSKATREQQMQQAMEDYFFRQSRLPPSGATAFDPGLTPAWAGMKLPG